MVRLGNDWDALLAEEFSKDYYRKLRAFLKSEYETRTIYPDMHDIFNALKATSYGNTRVVILGQDPYHGQGQAHGMCFSVQPGVPKPPSLVNVFKELQADLGVEPPSHGHLIHWARQGVLMLNTVLTVRAGSPNSHKGKGWEMFTDEVIRLLDRRERPMVFLLWGANARAKKALIDNPSHLILEAAHPSPLSAHNGFFGCRHFSGANAFLQREGMGTVDWKI
ncbi:MAG TPA: uracil-DNA glycosylase [Anaerovoracaceae bacterium]|nr:uracil-DNA glycosylase [Bacillota bacterium]HRV33504.1 uracil-DNA glycosylase [Anaerovoracaceae bacterium]